MKSLCASVLLAVLVSGSLSAAPKAAGSLSLIDTAALPLGDEKDIANERGVHHVNVKLDELRAFEAADDGTRFLAIKISLTGLPTARVLFQNVALGANTRLYVYGIDAKGNATEAHGPYTGAGPQNSGEFWSGAVTGEAVVIELQADDETPSLLPFDVAGVAASETIEVLPIAAAPETLSKRSFHRGVELTHAIVDNQAVFEGDILLDEIEEISDNPSRSKTARKEAVARSGAAYRWPNGTIPYTIDSTIPNNSRITAAIAHWNTVLVGNVRLMPRTTETAYVKFVRSTSSGTCSSYVGKTGGAQSIQVGDSCSAGNMIHEIGHAVGLWHEQGREDRNSFVRVLLENIQSGQEHNFNQYTTNGDDVGSYDFASIMHYPATGFSANGKPTIETIPAGIPIGQRSGLSPKDIAAVRQLYPATIMDPGPTQPVTPPAPESNTVAISLISNPSGQTLIVDGVPVVTPAVRNWIKGSTHTLSYVNADPVNGVRLRFASWSDGGPSARTITTPQTAAGYQANYSAQYLLQVSTSGHGAVTRTPATADSYYAYTSSVSLTATPAAGNCFAGWTGFVAGTPAETKVSMRAYTPVTANFIPGAVTVPAEIVAPAAGGVVEIPVDASTGCLWSATSSTPWAALGTIKSGTGSAVLQLNVAANTTGTPRSGRISVAGQAITITQ